MTEPQSSGAATLAARLSLLQLRTSSGTSTALRLLLVVLGVALRDLLALLLTFATSSSTSPDARSSDDVAPAEPNNGTPLSLVPATINSTATIINSTSLGLELQVLLRGFAPALLAVRIMPPLDDTCGRIPFFSGPALPGSPISSLAGLLTRWTLAWCALWLACGVVAKKLLPPSDRPSENRPAGSDQELPESMRLRGGGPAPDDRAVLGLPEALVGVGNAVEAPVSAPITSSSSEEEDEKRTLEPTGSTDSPTPNEAHEASSRPH